MNKTKYWLFVYFICCFTVLFLINNSPLAQVQRNTFQPNLGPYDAVVMITIDDVSISEPNLNRLLTLLNRFEIPATLGVITSRADWGLLKTLSNTGYEIASHSQNHPFSFNHDFDSEIGGSKTDIEYHLNVTVMSYICPDGVYSNRIIQAIQKYGYLVFRDLGNNRVVNTTRVNTLYRAEVSAEAGPWGTETLAQLNAKFETAKLRKRPYSLVLHPNHINIEILSQHLAYIRKMDGVKFMTMGDFYVFQDNI